MFCKNREKIEGREAIVVTGLGSYLLTDTLECGQCFRHVRLHPAEGSRNRLGAICENYVEYMTVVEDELIFVGQRERGELLFFDMSDECFERLAVPYFSLDTDYRVIKDSIISSTSSDFLKKAADVAEGIRILRQSQWETLFSFIISQNNNIPRIKKIIRNIALAYGENLAVKHGLAACPIALGEGRVTSCKEGRATPCGVTTGEATAGGATPGGVTTCEPTTGEATIGGATVSGERRAAACKVTTGEATTGGVAPGGVSDRKCDLSAGGIDTDACLLCGACYSFPTAGMVADAPELLLPSHPGFRYKYLVDAAERVSSGAIDLDDIRAHGSYEYTLSELMKIKGVGEKVASCTSLFAFSNLEAFPIDVWMRRAIDEYFGGELDPKALGPYAGVAQQYIFHYIRILNGI